MDYQTSEIGETADETGCCSSEGSCSTTEEVATVATTEAAEGSCSASTEEVATEAAEEVATEEVATEEVATEEVATEATEE